MHRNTCFVFFAALQALILFAGPSHASNKKTIAFIGFSKGVDQPFWIAMGESVQKTVEGKNVNYIDLTPATSDPQEQKRLLEYAVEAKKVDGIILGANLPAVLKGALDKARAAHIPIITIDTEVDHPAVKGFIATDNFASAELMGGYIVKTTGKGSVLILGGTSGHPNGDARRDGVKKIAESAGMKVIFRYADWKIENAFQIVTEELDKPNDIVAIFSCNDPMANAAKEVVKAKNLSEKIKIFGFDGLEAVYKNIKTGAVTATIAQPIQTMAREGVRMMMDLLSGKTVAPKKLIPGLLVDKDNIDNYFKK